MERRKIFLCILADVRMCECQLGLSTSIKDIFPVIVVDATLALAIFKLNFRVNSDLNSLYIISNQAITSSSKMIIILDCQSLRTEIGFFNTILSFNETVIDYSSFFLLTLFKVF